MSTVGPPRRVEAHVIRHARRVITPALIAAGVGLLGFVGGLILDPQRALYSYLAAFAFGISVALGALFMVMISHVTNAKWFVVVRRIAESIAGTLPLFAILVIPVLAGAGAIYPWVTPVHLPPEEAANVATKAAYLNVPFFIGRTIIYFLVWIGLDTSLRRWSLRQDRDPDDAPPRRAVNLSGPGLAATGLTVSFAAMDWLMSLSPTWVSSVFGAYWFAGTMYAGIAAITVAAAAFQRSGLVDDEVASGQFYALGRLMLVFTILWAYLGFSQGFLMYIADLPHEITWYLDRTLGGWGVVFGIVVIGHFFVPFFALLSYRIKQDGRRLALVAGWMLLMSYVEMFWFVIPALHGRDFSARWFDPFTLLLVLGAAIAFGAWRLTGEATVPWRDPRILASIGYRRE